MGIRTRLIGRSTQTGVFLIVAGVILLVGLRFWASPLSRRILGREPAGVVDFVGIPVFLAFVGAGIVLFLWEPEDA